MLPGSRTDARVVGVTADIDWEEIGLTGFTAAWLPALRASRVNPVRVLRAD